MERKFNAYLRAATFTLYPADPIYTVPDEFGTGLKFVHFSFLFTREPRNRTNLRLPNRTNSRVNRRKRTNFNPVRNLSGTV